MSINDLGFNGVFIELDVKIQNILKKFLIGSIYIPTNLSSSTMIDGLNKIMLAAGSFDGVILGGDLNAKNPTWGDTVENGNGRNLHKWLQDNSLDVARLCDTNPSYPNGSSFLDHYLVSTHLLNTHNQNFTIESLPSFSDHFPIKLKLDLGFFDFVLRSPQTYTSYKNTNWNNFRKDLELVSNRMMPPTNISLKNQEIDRLIDDLNIQINVVHKRHSEQIELYDKKKPLPENLKNLYKINSRWQAELKKIFHRTGNRISQEYSILSKQLQLLKIILKELVAINDSTSFGQKLQKIKPGPRAFREVNQMLGEKRHLLYAIKLKAVGYLLQTAKKLLNISDHTTREYSRKKYQQEQLRIWMLA